MSDDIVVPEPPKRGNDVAFFGLVVILVMAVFGGAIYLKGAIGGSNDDAPPASPGAKLPTSPSSSKPSGAEQSKAAAAAVVRKYFQLALAGNHKAACALESPAYRRFDARTSGSCEAASRRAEQALEAHGLTMKFVSARIGSFAPGEATIVVELTVGSKTVSANDYVQYHGGKWWITGADDSGDVGFQ